MTQTKEIAKSVHESLSVDDIDALLTAWVMGDVDSAISTLGDADIEQILLRMDFHGVAGLIDLPHLISKGVPETIKKAIRDRVVALEVWELEHKRVLSRVLEALSVAGFEPLLVKGSGLAYRIYTPPAARQRGDSDIMVAPEVFDLAAEVLTDLGGNARAMPAGPIRGTARHFFFQGAFGFDHEIDLHFGISGPPAIRGVLEYKELSKVTVSLPRLSPHARTICDCHALILASMHRLKHRHAAYYSGGVEFRSADRLIWLYDIHLLSRHMTDETWQKLLVKAKTAGLSGAVALGLEAANKAFDTAPPFQVMNALQRQAKGERPTRYLTASVFGQLVMNFWALPDLRSRARFAREVCFPDSEHMHTAFADVRPQWLPWLYMHRALRGIGIFWRGDWGGEK